MGTMQEEVEKLEWLRSAIAEADADIAAGRTFTAKQVREELTTRRKALLAARLKP
jgi:predicted transcriptional regulator